MDLGKEFQKYVGVIIKDPERQSMDTDSVASQIASHGRDVGCRVTFTKDTGNKMPNLLTRGMPTVDLTITKQGVPADQSWGWRIESLNVK